jgi:hypothetical protein
MTMLTTFLRSAPSFDPDSVTPGVIGFIATAVVAIAVCFLLFDMNRRVRRVKYREEARADIAAELAGGAQGASTAGESTTGAPTTGAPTTGTASTGTPTTGTPTTGETPQGEQRGDASR